MQSESNNLISTATKRGFFHLLCPQREQENHFSPNWRGLQGISKFSQIFKDGFHDPQASRKVLTPERISLASASWHHEVVESLVLDGLKILNLNFDELLDGFHVTFISYYWDFEVE